jgi:hypothetical protein
MLIGTDEYEIPCQNSEFDILLHNLVELSLKKISKMLNHHIKTSF